MLNLTKDKLVIVTSAMEPVGVKRKIKRFFEERVQHGETEFSTYFMKITKCIRLYGILPITEKSRGLRVLKITSINAVVGLMMTIVTIAATTRYTVQLAMAYRSQVLKSTLAHWELCSEVSDLLEYIMMTFIFNYEVSTFFDLIEQWKNISRQIQRSIDKRPYYRTYIICQALTMSDIIILSIIYIAAVYNTGIDQSHMHAATLESSYLIATVLFASKLAHAIITILIRSSTDFLILSVSSFIEEYNMHLEQFMESHFSKHGLVSNRRLHFAVYKLSEDVNKAIAPMLLADVSLLVVFIILTGYGMASISMLTTDRIGFALWLLCMFMHLVLLCEGGHCISYQSKKTETILCKYSFVEHLNLSDEMRIFVMQVKMFPMRLNLCDFVLLDRNSFMTFIGSISTYFVVLLQLFPQ